MVGISERVKLVLSEVATHVDRETSAWTTRGAESVPERGTPEESRFRFNRNFDTGTRCVQGRIFPEGIQKLARASEIASNSAEREALNSPLRDSWNKKVIYSSYRIALSILNFIEANPSVRNLEKLQTQMRRRVCNGIDVAKGLGNTGLQTMGLRLLAILNEMEGGQERADFLWKEANAVEQNLPANVKQLVSDERKKLPRGRKKKSRSK